MLTAKVVVEPRIRGADGNLAALWHRVFGVHYQVHDDLLDLARIGASASQFRRQLGDQFDVFANERTQKAFHVAHNGVDVDYLQFEQLLTAKGQQLTCQRGRTIGGLLNGFDLGK